MWDSSHIHTINQIGVSHSSSLLSSPLLLSTLLSPPHYSPPLYSPLLSSPSKLPNIVLIISSVSSTRLNWFNFIRKLILFVPQHAKLWNEWMSREDKPSNYHRFYLSKKKKPNNLQLNFALFLSFLMLLALDFSFIYCLNLIFLT